MGIEGLMMVTQLSAPRGRDTGLTSLLQAAKEIICVGYCVLNTGEEKKNQFPLISLLFKYSIPHLSSGLLQHCAG